MSTCKTSIFVAIIGSIIITACRNKDNNATDDKTVKVLKGLYSYGPEVKSFTDCEYNREYWVADSAKTLELGYVNLGFEKPYTPVYIEVECKLVKSDTSTVSGSYDSTMVVTKLLKISKQIPEGPCSQ